MSLIVSSLSTYAFDKGPKLMSLALLKNSLTKIATPYQSTGGAFDIPVVTSVPVIQGGGVCGTSKSGSTTITSVRVTLCDLMVADSLCVNTLKSKLTSQYVSPDMNETQSLGMMTEDVVNSIIDGVAVKVEKGLWGYDTDINTTLNCVGIKQLVENTAYSGSVVTVNFTGATTALSGNTTSANVLARVNELTAAYSVDATSKPSTLFVTPQNYKLFLQALTTANLFHYKPDDVIEGCEIPGSMGIRISPMVGLTDNKIWYLTYNENIAPVFNKIGAEEDITFEKGSGRTLDYFIEWKQGVQIIFPTQMVVGRQP